MKVQRSNKINNGLSLRRNCNLKMTILQEVSFGELTSRKFYKIKKNYNKNTRVLLQLQKFTPSVPVNCLRSDCV